MGAQIAAHFANAGLQVYLLDIAPKEGPKNAIVEKSFKAATKLKPAPFFSSAAKSRITLGNFDEDFDYLKRVDWVIEVVIERMDINEASWRASIRLLAQTRLCQVIRAVCRLLIYLPIVATASNLDFWEHISSIRRDI